MHEIRHKPSRGVFVTGTDTEVGKTYVSCAKLRQWRSQGVRVCAYKPVASGAESFANSDAYHLWRACGCDEPVERINPQSFLAPLAPPIAAELQNQKVDERLLLSGVEDWFDRCDFLLVEGAGGLMSPITWELTNADLAVAIGYPVWLVAPNRLGVVHQILATVTVAVALGLDVQTIVLNDMRPGDTELAAQSNARLLAPFLERISPRTRVESFAYGR